MKLKSPEKEELIYQTVLDITMEKGLSGLKISEIARQAGLAHGTVYIYFKNKKVLINELYKKAKRKASNNILDSTDLEGDYRVTLKLIWENYLSYLIDNQRATNFLMQCVQSPFLEKESLKIGDDFLMHLNLFFEKGKKDRQIKNLNNELIISVIIGLAKEIVRKVNEKTLKISDELIEDSFELCWNAIRR
ncbi:MAG: TetR/AcrR family transcriptional regulator [Saprospiraceae bacterium]